MTFSVALIGEFQSGVATLPPKSFYEICSWSGLSHSLHSFCKQWTTVTKKKKKKIMQFFCSSVRPFVTKGANKWAARLVRSKTKTDRVHLMNWANCKNTFGSFFGPSVRPVKKNASLSFLPDFSCPLLYKTFGKDWMCRISTESNFDFKALNPITTVKPVFLMAIKKNRFWLFMTPVRNLLLCPLNSTQ